MSITAALADRPIAGVNGSISMITKGGLNSATQNLAIEYARDGIRFNAVAPGEVDTPMHRSDPNDSTLQPAMKKATVKDIVDAVLYLAQAGYVAERYSTWMVPLRLVVGSGRTIQYRSGCVTLDFDEVGMPRLLSVNVGLPRDVTWNGKTVRTSVWKSPVDGRRMVRKLDIDGDAQADLPVTAGSSAPYSSTRWNSTITGRVFGPQ